MAEFILDDRLQGDTFFVGDLPLSKVLLMNDARYPWVILVPRQPDITELHQLNHAQQQQLMSESCQLAAMMETLFSARKMNVGALGNIVSQLHLHHIARQENDPAWPGPVWGHSPAVAYDREQSVERIAQLKRQLNC